MSRALPMAALLAVTTAILTAAGCSAMATQALADGGVLAGDWGGPHIALSLSGSGGQIDLDCAHGSFTGPLNVAADGTFKAQGSFTREHGGPVRRDSPSAESPATYSGKVIGGSMQLNIVAGADSVGEFVLEPGQAAQLMKCR